ncbi:MAG TPA: hypothetical protein PKY88_05120 [Anaerohalosphaeraceae bacterium]|nr:hypothetical protein [Anaerohalosphaeraceae bacterium]
MKFSTFLFLWFVGWLGFGCQAPPAVQNPASAPLPRLKITDLAPQEQPSVQVQSAFAVIVWRVPLDKMQDLPRLLPMLSSKGITFSDPSAFESNGLWAAAGSYDQAPAVLSALEQIGAKRLGTKKLLIFQDYPEEITGFPVEAGQTLFYFGTDKIPAGKQVPGGRMSLTLRARPDTPQRGFVSVRIEPLFQPAAAGYGRAGISLFENLSFREGRLLTSMTEGDLLVLASPKPEEMSVFSRFFSAPTAKEPGMLLFLIVCQKAGD